MTKLRTAVLFTLLSYSGFANADSTEVILKAVIEEQQLRPLATRKAELDPKFELGRSLFFDPILSGNRDVACATCHLLAYGSSDGRRLSVGVGGSGIGPKRIPKFEIEHPRNSQDLWNRDHNTVSALFWDGRVEMIDPLDRTFRSPLGSALPDGYENTLAVQAIFPVTRPDEMLGLPGQRSSSNLSGIHKSALNEIATGADFSSERSRISSALKLVIRRLLDCNSGSPTHWQLRYREMFANAYPKRVACDFSYADAANAIAHYEELAFATRNTPWDRYLAGDESALSAKQKRGAVVFFGAGRCAVCHSGDLFSDFDYHSIGVPAFGPGINSGKDMGRFHVTKNPIDKFHFRTPPLRNVSLSAPYFHNGIEPTLDGVIRQHIDPLRFARQYNNVGDHAMTPAEIDSVSPILADGLRITETEIGLLIAFLDALTNAPDQKWQAELVPSSVPSGLDITPFQD
ncbi:MAG: His-Xaa-Ser system-associated MauG-like protein [Woeseia sp.]